MLQKMNLAFAALLALAVSFVPSIAFAGDLADAVTAEVTGAKAEMLLVAVVVLGLAGTLLLIKYVRRSMH